MWGVWGGCFWFITASSLVAPEKFYESLIDTVSKVIKVSVYSCVYMRARVHVCVSMWTSM